MNRLKIVTISLVGLLLVACAAFPAWKWLNRTGLAYIEDTTGVAFPPSVSDLEIFDNAENFVAAHLRLPEGDIVTFANNHEFGTNPVDITPWIGSLSSPNRAIEPDTALLYLEGQNNSNRWAFVLDQATGRVWMVVFYPDPGGGLP